MNIKTTSTIAALVTSIMVQAQDIREFDLGNDITLKMMLVEGGSFTMGGTATGTDADEYDSALPAHEVTLSTYYIGQTEITFSQWCALLGMPAKFDATYPDTGMTYYEYFLENGILPTANTAVYYVTHTASLEFISELNTVLASQLSQDEQFSLPTEAQWEFAARGGNQSQSFRFAGSNTANDVAWSQLTGSEATVHEVALLAPNELGLYDMTGNVAEWCSDVYAAYSADAQTNPTGPGEDYTDKNGNQYRVVRGGSCNSRNESLLEIPTRAYSPATNEQTYYGLRIVLNIPDSQTSTSLAKPQITKPQDVELYDLMGRKVTRPTRGLYIRRH